MGWACHASICTMDAGSLFRILRRLPAALSIRARRSTCRAKEATCALPHNHVSMLHVLLLCLQRLCSNLTGNGNPWGCHSWSSEVS